MKSIIHDVIDDMFVGIEKATSLDSRSLKTKQKERSSYKEPKCQDIKDQETEVQAKRQRK